MLIINLKTLPAQESYNFHLKFIKKLFDVPGKSVISNCGGATEKVSEFLDHHLKPIMQ